MHSNIISKNNQNNFNCETVIISKVIKSFDCRAYHQVSLILPGLYMYNLKGIITDKIVLFLSHLVFCSPQEIYDFTMWYFLSAKGTHGSWTLAYFYKTLCSSKLLIRASVHLFLSYYRHDLKSLNFIRLVDSDDHGPLPYDPK